MSNRISENEKEETLKESKVKIVLPEENYTLIQYKVDELPCIAAVNAGLCNFEHKEVFLWHLSIIIDFESVINNGMPAREECDIVDPFCDQLNIEIKAGGNAVFLARETWNKTRRLEWMVYNPEIAAQHLQYIIDHHRHPRPFDYHMKEDTNWEQAEWYFNAIGK